MEHRLSNVDISIELKIRGINYYPGRTNSRLVELMFRND